MYTEIRDECVIYWDAVRFSNFLPTEFPSEAAWVAEHQDRPSVSITTPDDGSRSASGSSITLSATAADEDGISGRTGIAKVEFFVQEDCIVATDMTPPYSVEIVPNVDGAYNFTARVTDYDGFVATSTVVSVISGPVPPTLSLTSPPTRANFASGNAINVAARVVPGDNTIASVQFFARKVGETTAQSIGTDISPSSNHMYEIQWTPPNSDGYYLHATVTDTIGKVGNSETARITSGGVVSTTTLTPSDDAAVYENNRNNNANYGGVEIYGRPDGNMYAGIFKIDASSLESAAEIRSAQLQLYVSSLTDEGPLMFSIWSTVGREAWTEESVTWNTAPTRTERISVTSISTTGWSSFDVTAYLDSRLKAGLSLASLTFWVQGDRLEYERIEVNSIRESLSNNPVFAVEWSSVPLPVAVPPSSPSSPAGCPSFRDSPHTPSRPPAPLMPPAPPESPLSEHSPPAVAPAPATSPNACPPASESTVSLTSVQDASINSANPSATGQWSTVEVYGNHAGGGIVGIVKFELPAGGSHVASAVLRMYASSIHNGGGEFAVHAASGSDGWEESAVTWSTAPSKGGLITTVSITEAVRWYDVDVTSYVAARASVSVSVVTLWIEASAVGGYKKFEFHSRSRENPPTLTVTTSSGCDLDNGMLPPSSVSPLPSPPPLATTPVTSPSPPPPYPPMVGSQFVLDWESGFPDGTPHLSPRGVEPSFSFNRNSNVVTCSSSTSDSRRRCKCGENGYSPYHCEVNFGMSDLHYHEMMTVPWARKGNGVLKFYADGRNAYGQGSGDSSFRSELGAPQTEFIFVPGDEVYYSASFWLPGEYWDTVKEYSIVISQFKMDSQPHGELRLSNRGDYQLYYRNARSLWDSQQPTDDGAPLGTARRNAWNDVKIYYRKSLSSDGQVRVYLNGEKVFEHHGATLHGRGSYSRGYVKFGMYTEIRDVKVIYFDAVSYSTFRPPMYASEAAWVASTLSLPTVAFTSPSNGFHGASGAAIQLTATASDPGGAKLDVPGQIAKVEWFVRSDCLIVEDTTAPYAISWTPPRDGTYELHVRATDADGNVVNSSAVTVHSGSRPPTVALTSPTMSANVAAVATTTIRAAASSPGGSVSQVEFFAIRDGASVADSLGVVTSTSAGEYSMVWATPAQARAYTLYAVATNSAGQTTTSAYVGITVGANRRSVTMTPTDDASLKAKTSDRNSNSNYASIEIYAREPDGNDGSPQAIYGIWKVDASVLAGQAAVLDAKLRLWVDSGSLSPSSGADFSVWSTSGSSSWAEDSVTWNNGPRAHEKLSVTRVTSDGRYYDFDVTSYLNAQVEEGSSLGGVTLWVQGDEGNYERFNTQSIRTSNANPPQLHVTYSDVAVKTAVPSANVADQCSSLVGLPATSPPVMSSPPAVAPAPTPSLLLSPYPSPPPALLTSQPPSPSVPMPVRATAPDFSGASNHLLNPAHHWFNLDWESGLVDGSPHVYGTWCGHELRTDVNSCGLEPEYAFNGVSQIAGCGGSNEYTACKCGVGGVSFRNCQTLYGASSLHYQSLETVDWARRGRGVLKMYSDGRNLGMGDNVPSGQYASNRNELAGVTWPFFEGDDVYFTASFWLPGEYWDRVTRYSIIIFQFKYTNQPHGAIRLSNLGDYNLYYEFGDGIGPPVQSGPGVHIGTARRNAWNDLKVYNRKSTGSSGKVRAYLNGELVLEHAGATCVAVA